MSNYKHGNWYCKPKTEAEAKEIIERAVASGAVLHESVGADEDRKKYPWSLFPLWGVNEGLTFTTNVEVHHSVFADAQELTIQQVRERFPLPNRADWTKAPHDAQFYSIGAFRKRENGKEYLWHEAEWRKMACLPLDGHESFPDFEFRPESVNKEWDGEDLPPIGTVCGMYWGGEFHAEVEIIQYRRHGNQIVYWNRDKDRVDAAEAPAATFRPLHTKRNKWVEAALSTVSNTDNGHLRYFAESIYDALESGQLNAVEVK